MNNTEIKKREYFVDIAKGIGIILVMFGHTLIGPAITKYSYIFNLPCFLLLSGYFFNMNKYSGYKSFLKSKAKAILIPYVGLSVFSIVFYMFYYNMPMNDWETIRAMVAVFFTAKRNQIFYNIPLWFLPSLFFIENIFYWIRKINRKYLEWILILILGGYFVMKWDTLYNPRWIWTIDSSMFYLIFFSLGYYIKQGLIDIKINKFVEKLLVIAAILINTLVIYNAHWFDKIFKNTFVMNNGLIYFISLLVLAFSGIYMVITVSKLIKRQAALEFLGKNSITFFGLHVLCFWILDKTIKPLKIFENNQIILSILYVWITILTVSLLIPYLKQYFPNIFGKN